MKRFLSILLSAILVVYPSLAIPANEYMRYLASDIITKGPVVDVRAFGAVGDGVTDDTLAIDNAIKSAVASDGVGEKTIYFPAGKYLITDNIIISKHRTRLIGSGVHNTEIIFNPTSEKVCFDFIKSSTTLVQSSISGIGFQSTNSTKKTAIRVTDANIFDASDIAISYTFSGNSSIGIHLRGKDMVTLNRVTIYTDRPILIDDNPNSTIDSDHYHFKDLYLIVNDNTQAAISISSGVNITNLIIDGYQAWAQGKYGIYWNDTTASQCSLNISFNNIRWEQATDTTGYMLYINHNYCINNLSIRNIYGTYDQATGLVPTNGIYLKNVRYPKIEESFILAGAGKTSLNIDNTNQSVLITNTSTYSSATVVLPPEKLFIQGTSQGYGIGFYDNIADGNYYKFRVSGIEITNPSVPDNTSSGGIKGSVSYDDNCIYWAKTNNSWKRVCDNTSNNW